MNRERLKYRKFLREMAMLAGGIGIVLVLFDWLLWRLVFPTGPWWLRIAGDVAGAASIWASIHIAAHAKTLGRRRRDDAQYR